MPTTVNRDAALNRRQPPTNNFKVAVGQKHTMSPDHQQAEITRQNQLRALAAARRSSAEIVDEARVLRWRFIVENKLGRLETQNRLERVMTIEAKIDPDFDSLSAHEQEVRAFSSILRMLGISPQNV